MDAEVSLPVKILMDAVCKWYNFPRESSDKGEKKEKKKKLFPLKEK